MHADTTIRIIASILVGYLLIGYAVMCIVVAARHYAEQNFGWALGWAWLATSGLASAALIFYAIILAS